jgi:hypothetical protein
MSPFYITTAYHNVQRYAQSIGDIWNIVILQQQIPAQVFNKTRFSYEAVCALQFHISLHWIAFLAKRLSSVFRSKQSIESRAPCKALSS